MKDVDFYNQIANSSASRPDRETNANRILLHPKSFEDFLSLVFDKTDSNHYKACWILEIVVEKNSDLLKSHFDKFFRELQTFSHDSAIRSISKICMLLAKRNAAETTSGNILLTEIQLRLVTEACFDWLIGDVKVASKAYAMRSLFEIGKTNDWIYPQLLSLLEKDSVSNSAGYKAAAKDILRKIKRK